MRIRKKKYLNERLEKVADLLFVSDLDDRNFNTAIEEKEYIDIRKWFGRSAPLYLEIGCGKGGFAAEFARRNPDINLLAVEKNSNVLVEACEKAQTAGLGNLKFIKCSAEYLPKYLKEDSIERIFLNFSCPFPKNAYATHRLTHTRFLEIYRRLLKKGGEIHQKTDNMHFFEFSLEQFSRAGFMMKDISLDLHASGIEDNIETEYEHRFASLGQPIYRLVAFAEENDD